MKTSNSCQEANAGAPNSGTEAVANGKPATPKAAKLNITNSSDANTPSYPVAKFSLLISDELNLTKRYDLVDGKVNKTAAGRLSNGVVMTYEKPIDQIIDVITKQATPQHALIHGVSGYDEIRVVTKGRETAKAISRSREYFRYDMNALLMFDHDLSKLGMNFTFESCIDFLETLAEGCNEIADAAFVVKTSSSAGIMLDGELISK